MNINNDSPISTITMNTDMDDFSKAFLHVLEKTNIFMKNVADNKYKGLQIKKYSPKDTISKMPASFFKTKKNSKRLLSKVRNILFMRKSKKASLKKSKS